jgi:glyceraldehyde-3-phosphate dehydrogenase/erythrose-4-phosphate dehydrogenase
MAWMAPSGSNEVSEKVSRTGVLWFVQSTLGLDPSEVVAVHIEHAGIEVELFDKTATIVNNEFVTYAKWYDYEDAMNLPWRYDAQDNHY